MSPAPPPGPPSGAGRRIRPSGPTAFLVELPSLEAVLALHAELDSDPLPGQLEVVAAARTVMVRAASTTAAERLAAEISRMAVSERQPTDTGRVQIDVCYDGPDLDDLSELLGGSREAVIAAHCGQLWTAAFGGFAPGFSYCIAQHHSLDVPRRSTPRTAVPAGSVGLAGPFSAVYPRTSPGGWQLIGRTTAVLWDPDRRSPALITAGSTVCYRAVRELVEVVGPPAPAQPAAARGLQILATGPQCLVTDLGRPGHADLGVAESGAMDRGAARLANVLVGNPLTAPLIENLAGGLQVRALGDQMVAVTGALVPLTRESSDRTEATNGPQQQPARGLQHETPIRLMDGEVLSLGAPAAGLRAYLAVRGGVDLPRVLGSAATDVMSQIGPAPLQRGQILPVAPSRRAVEPTPGTRPDPLPEGRACARVVLGPRDDWFTAEAVESLLSQRWRVAEDSNRIGLRLEGRPLQRVRQGELASEGTVAGSIQVTTAGIPVILMRDHPVTGGYPVIGVVLPADLDALAQLSPGARIDLRLG
ncbi:urea amidolyase family protein [Acidipropionibacterium thoenii]|uniref:5-oxoprolinase subunit B/C family protein n=1 Tax=Acidipropionibacterium thoenii TaxID=1751 RepID=UPI0004224B6E|nr:urea amidolyase family protein [Acidipropionibacterium thoenii]